MVLFFFFHIVNDPMNWKNTITGFNKYVKILIQRDKMATELHIFCCVDCPLKRAIEMRVIWDSIFQRQHQLMTNSPPLI